MSSTDLCECPALPALYWRSAEGVWGLAGELPHTEEMAYQQAVRDAYAYDALGCTGWVIACPSCGRVFLSGTERLP